MVLVELQKITQFGCSQALAQIRTPVGRAAVRWCGDQNALPGSYHVEWTVDRSIVWGCNAKPAAVAEPGVHPGGQWVILRGQVSCLEPGAAVMILAGDVILLDVEGSLPGGVHGTWVDLFIEPEDIALYPYAL